MDDSRLPNGDVPRSDAYAGPFGRTVKALREDAELVAIIHDARNHLDKMVPILRNNLDWAARQQLDCRARVDCSIKVTNVEFQAREFLKALKGGIATLDPVLAEAKACPNVAPPVIKAVEHLMAHARKAVRELEEGQENLERSGAGESF